MSSSLLGSSDTNPHRQRYADRHFEYALTISDYYTHFNKLAVSVKINRLKIGLISLYPGLPRRYHGIIQLVLFLPLILIVRSWCWPSAPGHCLILAGSGRLLLWTGLLRAVLWG